MLQQGDGGVSDLDPMGLFELTWSLHPLQLSGLISPGHELLQDHLAKLWRFWRPEKGMVYHEYFQEPDLDDTAVAFSLLKWGGYTVDSNVFNYFSGDNHFYCYHGESDPSLSANIRTLIALQTEKHHPN